MEEQFKRLRCSEGFMKFLDELRLDDEICHKLLRDISEAELSNFAVSYLDFSSENPTYLSYLNKQRYDGTIIEDNLHPYRAVNVRFHGKPAKIVRKIYEDRFTPKQYEDFANRFKAYTMKFNGSNMVLKVVSGTEIRKYYLFEHYADDLGTLGGSCMRDYGSQEYLDIYVKNDNCQMLILLNQDTDKISGRALLWQTTDGTKVMDRVYITHDHLTHLFLDWAKENGYWHKMKQSYEYPYDWIKPDNEHRYKTFMIELGYGRDDIDYWPYMDTFHYVNHSHASNDTIVDYISCRNTDGTAENDDVICEDCGCHVDQNDYISVDGECYCNDCAVVDGHGDGIRTGDAVYCENVSEYYHIDETAFSERDNCYYHTDDCTYCDLYEDYIDSERSIYSDAHESEIDSNLAEYSSFHCCDVDPEYCKYSDHHESYIVEDQAKWDDDLNSWIHEDDNGRIIYEEISTGEDQMKIEF
jgi:hypothetical protein